MPDETGGLGLIPPLTIRRFAESFIVRDAGERIVAATYFSADPESRVSARRVGPEEAERIAKVIARAVTREIEGGERT